MRIALAQINSTLGDFVANRNKILEFTQRAKDKHCDLVLFPESCLFGYLPTDLLERSTVVEDQLKELRLIHKKMPSHISIIFGAITENTKSKGKPWHNSAILLRSNIKPKVFSKTLLPCYDVFDETRYMEPGDITKNIFPLCGKKILVSICEDIWAWPEKDPKKKTLYPDNPLKSIPAQDVDLVLNLSASPFAKNKLEQRLSVAKKTNHFFKCPLIYVNMVGSQDELIFDGGSFATNAQGKILCQSIEFEEDLNILDLPSNKVNIYGKKNSQAIGGMRSLIKNPMEKVRQALVLGLRDFSSKVGLGSFHLGLSGGIDSAIVACLAVDALGPNRVTCIALPGPYNASKSLRLAKELSDRLSTSWLQMPIVAAYEELLSTLKTSLGDFSFGLTNENLQARIRGTLLMAYGNKHSSLLLNTSNKSELAVGYSTLYGDLCGGICPIGDLLKTEVNQLAQYYNEQYELIPTEVITRPPSAELSPNQKDEDSLPPYEILDPIIVKLVENFKPARSKLEKEILEKILQSEFKRWQAPPILKISPKAFGRGRRRPLAHRAFR